MVYNMLSISADHILHVCGHQHACWPPMKQSSRKLLVFRSDWQDWGNQRTNTAKSWGRQREPNSGRHTRGINRRQLIHVLRKLLNKAPGSTLKPGAAHMWWVAWGEELPP